MLPLTSIGQHGAVTSQLRSQTRKATALLLATLMGGLLVVNSFLIKLFPSVFGDLIYSTVMAIAGTILLGGPLVWHSIKHLWSGQLHMDELAAVAILAACASGMYQEAGVVAFFMVLSNLVETRTALGARMAIEGLVRITPTKATRLTTLNGQPHEEAIDAAALQPGDVVRVRPGDNIPADAEVLVGESTVNQASITGESLPVERGPGDDVFSGTINLTGQMDLRVTKAGSDTTLGRVQNLILDAERTKIPLMRLIDEYVAWYTPIVLMVAGMVWFFSMNKPGALENAITMLVIACPCALVLATPTAMVAALSAAARLGILVKAITNLEAARKITAIIFDKTGTLTTGELNVTRLTPVEGVDPAELLHLSASVEAGSRHPVAKAVVAIARKANLQPAQVSNFAETSGKGVIGTVQGQRVMVGRASFLQDHGVGVPDFAASNSEPQTPNSELQTHNSELKTHNSSPPSLPAPPEGLSLLFVAIDGRLAGWIGLEDKTRSEARTALDDLRKLGVTNLTMVTGDRWPVARKVAAEMGCTQVQAEVLPADKLAIVRRLKSEGHFVAVVGDGVNDAPALASGDIGIAMGAAGSDIAIHSASIALMNSDLRRLPFLVELSRHTTRVIYQNLGFGMAFIVVFMTLSALGYLQEFGGVMLAAFLHTAGSLVVILNSARIVRYGEQLFHIAPTAEPTPTEGQAHLEPVPAMG